MKTSTDWKSLKQLGKELLDALPTANPNEAEAGFKCFALAFISANFSTSNEELQAHILMNIMSKKKIEHEIQFGFPNEFIGS